MRPGDHKLDNGVNGVIWSKFYHLELPRVGSGTLQRQNLRDVFHQRACEFVVPDGILVACGRVSAWRCLRRLLGVLAQQPEPHVDGDALSVRGVAAARGAVAGSLLEETVRRMLATQTNNLVLFPPSDCGGLVAATARAIAAAAAHRTDMAVAIARIARLDDARGAPPAGAESVAAGGAGHQEGRLRVHAVAVRAALAPGPGEGDGIIDLRTAETRPEEPLLGQLCAPGPEAQGPDGVRAGAGEADVDVALHRGCGPSCQQGSVLQHPGNQALCSCVPTSRAPRVEERDPLQVIDATVAIQVAQLEDASRSGLGPTSAEPD
mmetsp:Transcript_18138/g.50414  ORF Transcript_18138/g.50414 Transcript_18138/m.50414 type:complete len:321 (-) Transcript_18138:1080-2042(-)